MYLKIFENVTHVHIFKELKQKSNLKSKKYIHVNFVKEIKGCHFYDPKIHDFTLNKHFDEFITFVETIDLIYLYFKEKIHDVIWRIWNCKFLKTFDGFK